MKWFPLIFLVTTLSFNGVLSGRSSSAVGDVLTGPHLQVFQADTIRVAEPTGAPEIDRRNTQNALDAAKPGSIVQFAHGKYVLGMGVKLTVPEVTLLGHDRGTTIKGCEPEDFEVEMAEIVNVVFGCTAFFIQTNRQTIKNLTFEYVWHGIVIGPFPSTPEEGTAYREGTYSPESFSSGGHVIDGNIFRASPNGIRSLGTGDEVTVVSNNEFIDVFHAIGIYGGPLHFLNNRVTVETPNRVPTSAHPGSAIIVGPYETDCSGHVVSENMIEGYPDPIYVLANPGEVCRDVKITDNTIRAKRVHMPKAWAGYTPSEDDSTMVGIPINAMGRPATSEEDPNAQPSGIIENVLIRGNDIQNAEGLGILLQNVSNSRVEGNRVSEIKSRAPFPGITWDGFEPDWTDANGSGIWVSPGSEGNEIARNVFKNMDTSAIVIEGANNQVKVLTENDIVIDKGTNNIIAINEN